ncbi:MAG: thiamine pyrophosphate-dependent dehydrogenase E1 component subunit alpha [Pseudomonadota bacterium]|nr:thiamine pyrophosphate-dependent dehydrogenase E1 component subunit alpha [Pseudomonadota bacterium]
MSDHDPDRATLVDIYRRMSRIVKNDEQFREQIKTGRLAAIYYSPKGQEAIPAAVSACLDDTDYITTIYRGIHDMLAKGVPTKLLWAEVAGKVTGTCKGKGGPMHITHPASGCMLTTGIVGASMPVACGLALASQEAKDGRVTVANFGDGATNIGAFHESLNLASVWKLPVVFVCQNNQYAEHTAYHLGTSVDQIATRAVSYSMPGVRVDGNDPVAVYRVAKDAIERARAGEGPTLIEAVTFRFHGHVFGEGGEYMPRAELDAAMAADPFPRFRNRLLAEGVADAQTLDEIDAQISAEVDEAIQFAMDSDAPTAIELKRDVYAHELS